MREAVQAKGKVGLASEEEDFMQIQGSLHSIKWDTVVMADSCVAATGYKPHLRATNGQLQMGWAYPGRVT